MSSPQITRMFGRAPSDPSHLPISSRSLSPAAYPSPGAETRQPPPDAGEGHQQPEGVNPRAVRRGSMERAQPISQCAATSQPIASAAASRRERPLRRAASSANGSAGACSQLADAGCRVRRIGKTRHCVSAFCSATRHRGDRSCSAVRGVDFALPGISGRAARPACLLCRRAASRRGRLSGSGSRPLRIRAVGNRPTSGLPRRCLPASAAR
jgi:hypothetical protein